ncbi:MAG: thioredoxin [Caldilineaceae bacterium]|nr:thioredoxin [Caldilineaceae bacterium]
MAIDTVLHTNEQSVNRVLQTGLPVMLAFWSAQAPLAAPLESQLNQAAARYAGKLLIAKVDTSVERGLVERYGIRQTPALVLLKNKGIETTLAGVLSTQPLDAWLHYLVEGGSRPAQPNSAAANPTHSSDKPVTLTDANFDELIKGAQPVLVDFWAPWCGPCRMIAPTVEQLAQEFQGRAIVGKLNVDENPRIAQSYQIMGIPALYIFKQGRVVDKLVGVQPAAVLQQRLTRQLN